jgi:hypothetical protein
VLLSWVAVAQDGPFEAPINKQVRLDSTNLPIVWINLQGASVNLTTRVTARMTILDNGEGRMNYADTVAHPGQHIDYRGYIGIRYRGNTSFSYSAKKPYSFRPLDKPLEEGGDWKKVSLLGMGKDSKWILLAPYNDKSMMRDMFTFEVARPWMDYTPDGRYCEVLVNNVYYGVFILTEQVSQGKYRLNLNDPGSDGETLMGGFLMEVDRDDEPTYTSKHFPRYSNGRKITSRVVKYQYKYPDYEDLTPEQLEGIHSDIDRWEDVLDSDDFLDPERGYRNYMDPMSFIDYQLAQELSHNVDGYRLSGKFYKNRDAADPRFKVVLWDMNIGYGNVNYYDGWSTSGWIYQYNDILRPKAVMNLVPFWWYKLNSDPEYTKQLKARWAQYRRSNLSDEAWVATIDSISTLLTSGGAEYRNTQAYPKWGEYVWPNYYIASDFADEIAYLKNWIAERIAWMDEQLEFDPTAVDPIVGDVNGDGEVNIADVNAIIDVILGGEKLPAADVNGDGEINVADVNAELDIIFGL